jgi:hypothetical protein
MAGLKSPSKKKRDSSKPNTVLIVFLVFFILVSIGLGVWGYYGYAGQEKLEAAAKNEKKNSQAERDFKDYHMFMGTEARTAIGAPGNPKDPIVDQDDAVFVTEIRKAFLDPNSKYKAAAYGKYYEPMAKLVDALKTDLGGYDENTKRYNTSYRELVTKLSSDLQEARARLATADSDLKAANDKYQALQTKQEKYWTTALADIKKGNKDALTASTERTKAMEEQFALNQKLGQDIEEVKNKAAEKQEELNRRIRKLTEDADKLAKQSGEALPVNNARAGGEQPHALLLDISQGKPLWDLPLGKVTRVDWQARQLYINLGSANGMKPDVTFNIFAAGKNGRADQALKGTIEVIRVLDANSSLARITSVYDAEGREIILGDTKHGRPSREAENALKEGDLLYNTFWGSRVAIAGNIHFAGQASDNPAEQMRIMQSFANFLSRQGIVVDAYLDLNDGQVKGAITNRTRYLIRGDDLIDPARLGTPRRKEAAKEDAGEEKEKKDDADKAEAVPDRLKSISDAAAKMRQDAVDKGLLIISADNFLNCIGYREPRSAFAEANGFRPTIISAGQPSQPLGLQEAPAPKADERPDEKAAEKKAPDEK